MLTGTQGHVLSDSNRVSGSVGEVVECRPTPKILRISSKRTNGDTLQLSKYLSYKAS